MNQSELIALNGCHSHCNNDVSTVMNIINLCFASTNSFLSLHLILTMNLPFTLSLSHTHKHTRSLCYKHLFSITFGFWRKLCLLSTTSSVESNSSDFLPCSNSFLYSNSILFKSFAVFGCWINFKEVFDWIPISKKQKVRFHRIH